MTNNLHSDSILIERAKPEDFPQLLALNEAAVPNVNSISTETLVSLHAQALALIVAHDRDDESRLAGFLLALPEDADYASLNFQYFKSRYDDFAYVDRIIVNPVFRRRGVGAALYQKLFTISNNKSMVSCEVNLEPPNPDSIKFHEQMGFDRVGEQDTESGRKRVALLVRPLN